MTRKEIDMKCSSRYHIGKNLISNVKIWNCWCWTLRCFAFMIPVDYAVFSACGHRWKKGWNWYWRRNSNRIHSCWSWCRSVGGQWLIIFVLDHNCLLRISSSFTNRLKKWNKSVMACISKQKKESMSMLCCMFTWNGPNININSWIQLNEVFAVL